MKLRSSLLLHNKANQALQKVHLIEKYILMNNMKNDIRYL